ncbi:hypothetical protein [Aquibacillus albus]|uniref:Anti-sigma28 factor (Negative regulator of flagellin synthesis) n=1 Tax=Aquibacillus albus TaxID=1168171 RepID=A0ABS2MUS6_9BACI|nr:hypothetical protein [Aquibacillus albus]MBM7569624.1 anti-sigma28 factor (negative regulator of flagellin synthesis) [Aquibacillus albus]
MEDLIGIIIAIFVIGSWLFGSKKEDKKNTNRPPVKRDIPRPTPTPSGRVGQEVEDVLETQSEAFKDKKQEQLEALKDKIESGKHTVEGSGGEWDQRETSQKPKLKPVDRSVKQSTISVRRNLSSNKIVESVIMAEVLSPPKAHQKNQSRPPNRRI